MLMSYSLKYLWNTVNILQFAVFMEQWKLSLPNNGRKFLQVMKNLALMEFLPTDQVVDFMSDVLQLDEKTICIACIDEENETRRLETDSKNIGQDESNEVASMEKFGSPNLVRNLGIMFVIALAIAILLILLRLIKCLEHRYQWVRKLHKWIHDRIFYNLFIRYILQSTLKVQIAACTTI